MVAGLESTSEGTMRIGDRVVDDTEPEDQQRTATHADHSL